MSSPNYSAIVIGGSAGSFSSLVQLLSSLPNNFPIPIILCLHRLKDVRNGFAESLSIKSVSRIIEPCDKQVIRKEIYLAPSNYHLFIESGNYFSLSTEAPVHNSRPAIDLTMDSASCAYGEKLIGIILSGANQDGAEGMKKIKERGGLTIVQDPSESIFNTMPLATLLLSKGHHIMTIKEITSFFKELEKQSKLAPQCL